MWEGVDTVARELVGFTADRTVQYELVTLKDMKILYGLPQCRVWLNLAVIEPVTLSYFTGRTIFRQRILDIGKL